MKGVTILIDEERKNKIVQANIKYVTKNPSEFENLIRLLIEEYIKEGLEKKGEIKSNAPMEDFKS